MKIETSRKEFLTIYNALCYKSVIYRNRSLGRPLTQYEMKELNKLDSLSTKLLFRRIKKINGDAVMKIDLTGKEICILLFCVKELVTQK